MIIIKDLDLPTSIKISSVDKYIGVAGDNLFETRTFVIPKIYRSVDISTNEYTFLLQIQHSDGSTPYLDSLEKEIVDNNIYLHWKIQRYNCVAGELSTSILITNDTRDIVKQTYICKFICEKSINALDNPTAIPPSIFETSVIQAQAAANSAITAENSINELIENFDTVVVMDGDGTKYLADDGIYKTIAISDDGSISTDSYATVIYANTYLEFPNIGDSKNLYIDTNNNKSYRWDNINLKYFIIGSDYSEIKVINGGNSSDG